MFFVAGFAALADLAPPGRAGEALSLNSLALYLGIATGPLLGQWLLRWGGYDLAWAGATVLALLAAVLAARVPETRPVPDIPPVPDIRPVPETPPLLHHAALLPGLGLFCGVTAMSGFLAFAVLHARAIGIDAWSLVPLTFGGIVVICRIVFATLPDRVPPLRLAGAALVVASAGLVLVGAAENPVGLLLGTVLLGLGTAFLTPAIFAAVFRSVDATERGSAAATTSIFIDLGLGGGPLLLGALAPTSSLPTAFLLAAVAPLFGAAVVTLTGRREVAVS
jgi:predicted MFS family arabinose efflux permease